MGELEAAGAPLEAAIAALSPEGPFVGGQTFSYADLHVWPFLDRFRWTLAKYTKYNLYDKSKYPRLVALHEACVDRVVVRATTLPPEFIVKVYGGYASDEAKAALAAEAEGKAEAKKE